MNRELERGARKGYKGRENIQSLIDQGVIVLAGLGGTGKRIYGSLVTGGAHQTLDDGEASVIAHAVEIEGIGMIDERKAKKICRERFPQISMVTTIDLLISKSIEKTLGKERQKKAIYNALVKARMHVPKKTERNIVALIGKDSAKDCSSLSLESRLA